MISLLISIKSKTTELRWSGDIILSMVYFYPVVMINH